MPDATILARLGALPPLRALSRAGTGLVTGVPAGAVGLLAWWLHRTLERSVLLVSSDAELVYSDCAVWGGDSAVALFPAADTLPFDRVPPGDEVTRRRLGTLERLAGGEPALLVASPSGLLRPTLPLASVREGTLSLRAGEIARYESVVERLVALGYRREVAVSSPGEFAVRGGILDVFPPDRGRPWRAEWFGDRVEGLRAFDADTQTSVAALDEARISPARELDLSPAAVAQALIAVDALDLGSCREEVRAAWLRDREGLALGAYAEGVDVFAPYLQGERPTSLLDHLGEAVVVCAGGLDRLLRGAERYLAEAEGLRAQEEARGELPAGARTGLFAVDDLRDALTRLPLIEVMRGAPEGAAVTSDLGWRGVDSYVGRLDALAAQLRQRVAHSGAVLLLSRQQGRVDELMHDSGLDPIDVDLDDEPALPDGAVVAAAADLSEGFAIADAGLAVYTDHELFGGVKRRGSLLARGARRAESTSARGARRAASERAVARPFVIEFAPGDLVVHRDHGIGRFLDMRRVREAGGESEYMTLEYADGDKLYVPVAHLDRVDRYVGGAESRPHLSKLGTGEWERTKRRVAERTEEVARELLALYARRDAAAGHPVPPDGAWQLELEASFPYQETPDQELVLDEIKRDMESSKPMDRVVCGDVGFGKTELAVRAAFKAAVDGRQVAMLVPTTVLAQQHHITFTQRLAPFPVTVRQLSRFCSDVEIADTLTGLRSGAVDVVIGTHRLLQRDVEFRNLGLVIIDEEQRFGVLQKERFKQLRVAVDVLSLSATPIPRTLHMALAGIRDLSVIQTPPEERQPIKTFVTGRDEPLIREVITRELARSGQVYYVHNRVQSIDREAEMLRRLLPGVSIEVGHGQMPEQALARVMRRFSDGEIDVLACTTIIESGLDIPNANTIIINDSHRLGLAQLYQLRGRVGRAGQRAYAYFLYPPQRSLSERADKRLEVVADLQDLGAGFKLALRDLEIRGAGNLLGEAQHGEIAAVGLELYNHLLRDAVNRSQGRQVVESPAQITVSLPLPAYLPTDYVSDERLRLRLYQDLAACATEAELEQQGRGLVDRFGVPPQPVQALLLSLRVRLLAAACAALGVERDAATVTIKLPLGHGYDLDAVVRQFRSSMTASPTRLRIDTGKAGWEDVLVSALRELGRQLRLRQRAASA
jgi:transcription-repair coupling factor (superfamily II helicase)